MEITGVTFEGGITVGAPSVAGVLYSWGYNQIYGQLGLGDKTNRYTPTQVTAGTTPWKQITSGRNTSGTFSGAVANDGTLWTWGSNSSGSLGQGSYSGNEKSTPAQVGALNTWRQLTLGNNCGLAIRTNGTLWAWGDNGAGQLGLGAGVSGPASPRQVGADTTWVQVDSNRGNSTFGIKSDGTLWAWGSNFNGQLGFGTAGFPNISSPVKVGLLTNWAQVAGGKGESTFAVKTDGTLWAWGRNVTGTLGTNDTINRSSPVQIGADTNWAFVASGCGSSNSTAAIKTNGTLWTWGDNGSGQLGQGNTTVRSSPTQVGAQTNWAFVSVGGSFMLAAKTDGTLWSWGSDSDGTLGQGGTGNKNSPVQIGALTWWGSASSSYIAAGPREGFAITKITGAVNPPIELNDVTGTPSPPAPAWYTGQPMNVARAYLAGAGTQSAGLAFGGFNMGFNADTEEYDGSNWAIGGSLTTARYGLAGAGTQTAGLGFGGIIGGGTKIGDTEEYDGSVWTAGGSLNTARYTLAGAGTQSAGLAFGGDTGSITDATEEYNGSSWTTTGNMNVSRSNLAGFGVQTAALAAGGTASSTDLQVTEEYDGSIWTSGNYLNTARAYLAGCGTTLAGLAFGGKIGGSSSSASEEYDGSVWATGRSLSTARYELGGAGTQSAGLAFGGDATGITRLANTEEYYL